jgi:release factor glutamine methyltransferase
VTPRGSPTPEAWTVARVLQWAAQDFGSRGFDSPRLDAELLLGEVLGCDRIRLILDAARPLSPEELASYRELIKRRRGGEPVAYLLGTREFYGLPFRVDRRVLIPRPDTEVLVELALELTRPRSMFGRALDLCTGSGCVAIAFARHRRTWQVTATDRSAAALEVARDNALRLGAVHNTAFAEGDLFAAVDAEQRFDLITANPPYISASEYQLLDVGIREFEPRAALAGGADGLEIIGRLVAEAPRHLTGGGSLAVEIGYEQGPETQRRFEAAGFRDVGIRRDYGQRNRVVYGHLAG